MNQLSKKLMCVQMRSGVEIWVEQEKSDRLQSILTGITSSKFVLFEGQTFNTADVVGVFSAETMSDLTRRKKLGTKATCARSPRRQHTMAAVRAGFDRRIRPPVSTATQN